MEQPAPPIPILYEDNHLLIVNKPAGLATMGVTPDRPSLLTLAKNYIKQKYDKPGNVYLGIVSRLDAPVTGVVVLARTSKAAARLNRQFLENQVDKIYWAIVDAVPQPAAGGCVDWLGKDERHRRMHIAKSGDREAKQARLRYETLRRLPRGAFLAVTLETGRKHQIRLQLASRGWPITGDRKYGSSIAFPSGIALHARELSIEHPTLKSRLNITAPLPSSWRRFGVA